MWEPKLLPLNEIDHSQNRSAISVGKSFIKTIVLLNYGRAELELSLKSICPKLYNSVYGYPTRGQTTGTSKKRFFRRK